MSSLRVVKGAITTVVVAVVCFLPPGIHFVTGPLSPLIGGYAAGSRFHLNGGEAALVGLTLALAVGVPAPWVLADLDIIPHLATAALTFFSVVGALWFGVLGGAAAAFGGHSRSQGRDGTTD